METNLENKIKELENRIKDKDRLIGLLSKEIKVLQINEIAKKEKTDYLMSLYYDIFRSNTKVLKVNNLSFSQN